MANGLAQVYANICNRKHTVCAEELIASLNSNEQAALLNQRSIRLNDADISCIADVIRVLDADCALCILNLEENSFGLQGVQAIVDALEANPHHIRELRLGKNNLKDQAAAVIGHMLSRCACGLRVLDLSANGITKVGVASITTAMQSSTSTIVELSFYNNKIESEAASFIGQVIRSSPRLKHLHLGYNLLHDSGASELAKCLPHAVCLSTLDLTANNIGHEGGIKLAQALMSSTCTIQRLNLRCNLLDSSAIAKFADVLAINTSLFQLFLGFMNPTAEVASEVLRALEGNRTLLLLDINGWKLDPHHVLSLISAIQKNNTTVAAIVTDDCESIVDSIDANNAIREKREMHPIYIGPDDRNAYLATKSFRRYLRAHSRRKSRLSSSRHRHSSHRSSSRKPDCAKDISLLEGNGRASRLTSLNRSSSSKRCASVSARSLPHSTICATPHSLSYLKTPPTSILKGTEFSIDCSPNVQSTKGLPQDTSSVHQRIETLAASLEELRCELGRLSAQHATEIRTLTSRVESLEDHRECYSKGSLVLPTPKKESAHSFYDSNSLLVNQNQNNDTHSAQRTPISFHLRPRSCRSEPPDWALRASSDPVADTRFPCEGSPHINGKNNEVRPEETFLQRSLSVQNFPPRIEPSPVPDLDPPRRKFMPHPISM